MGKVRVGSPSLGEKGKAHLYSLENLTFPDVMVKVQHIALPTTGGTAEQRPL